MNIFSVKVQSVAYGDIHPLISEREQIHSNAEYGYNMSGTPRVECTDA